MYVLPQFKNKKSLLFLILALNNVAIIMMKNLKVGLMFFLSAFLYEFVLKRFSKQLNTERYLTTRFFIAIKVLLVGAVGSVILLLIVNSYNYFENKIQEDLFHVVSVEEMGLIFIAMFLVLNGFVGRLKWNG